MPYVFRTERGNKSTNVMWLSPLSSSNEEVVRDVSSLICLYLAKSSSARDGGRLHTEYVQEVGLHSPE